MSNIPTLGADQQVPEEKKNGPIAIFINLCCMITIPLVIIFVIVSDDTPESTKSPIEENMFHAGGDCKPLIEKHAKYSVKWTDSFIGGIFSKAGQNGKVISYYGDKVQLQNGFGAYTTYSYKCDYNTVTGTTTLKALEKGSL